MYTVRIVVGVICWQLCIRLSNVTQRLPKVNMFLVRLEKAVERISFRELLQWKEYRAGGRGIQVNIHTGLATKSSQC